MANHTISMSTKNWEAVKQLANSNTRGNVSELLATLIRMASMVPEQFNLEAPAPALCQWPEHQPTINQLFARGTSVAS